MQIREVEQLVS